MVFKIEYIVLHSTHKVGGSSSLQSVHMFGDIDSVISRFKFLNPNAKIIHIEAE